MKNAEWFGRIRLNKSSKIRTRKIIYLIQIHKIISLAHWFKKDVMSFCSMTETDEGISCHKCYILLATCDKTDLFAFSILCLYIESTPNLTSKSFYFIFYYHCFLSLLYIISCSSSGSSIVAWTSVDSPPYKPSLKWLMNTVMCVSWW